MLKKCCRSLQVLVFLWNSNVSNPVEIYTLFSIDKFKIKYDSKFSAFLNSDPQATRTLALWRGTKMTFYSSVLIWLFYKWMQSKSKKEVQIQSLFIILKT